MFAHHVTSDGSASSSRSSPSLVSSLVSSAPSKGYISRQYGHLYECFCLLFALEELFAGHSVSCPEGCLSHEVEHDQRYCGYAAAICVLQRNHALTDMLMELGLENMDPGSLEMDVLLFMTFCAPMKQQDLPTNCHLVVPYDNLPAERPSIPAIALKSPRAQAARTHTPNAYVVGECTLDSSGFMLECKLVQLERNVTIMVHHYHAIHGHQSTDAAPNVLACIAYALLFCPETKHPNVESILRRRRRALPMLWQLSCHGGFVVIKHTSA